ncbi:MAG: hypothetical protein RL367_2142 [Pseudomonadota bacterium]|jgi:AcrR family transcriptional regulator
MSTILKTKATPPAENGSRIPQQGRSKASLERMLAAAEALMLERGTEDFTLQDVSQKGNVSIGSIYLRFDGKDNLVRAVITQVLERVAGDEDAMLAAVLAESRTLADFVPHYVTRFAEVLKHHAPLLRLTMARAEHDPLVSGPGKASAFRSAATATGALLQFKAEFGGNDPELKANSAYHIIFATLARTLSLGSTGESALETDWARLTAELGRMCLAYFKHDG